jgi:Prokaryotic N-terminal methylation motif
VSAPENGVGHRSARPSAADDKTVVDRLRNESGFGMIELLIAMVLGPDGAKYPVYTYFTIIQPANGTW